MGLFSNPLERQYQREAIRYFQSQRREEQERRETAHREAVAARRQAERDAWAEQERQRKAERERERKERTRQAEEKAARLPRLIQRVSDAMDAKHAGNVILLFYGEKACTENFSDVYNLDLEDYRKIARLALYGDTLPERRAAAVIVKQATEIHGKDLLYRECSREQREQVLSEVQEAFDACSVLFDCECSFMKSITWSMRH